MPWTAATAMCNASVSAFCAMPAALSSNGASRSAYRRGRAARAADTTEEATAESLSGSRQPSDQADAGRVASGGRVDRRSHGLLTRGQQRLDVLEHPDVPRLPCPGADDDSRPVGAEIHIGNRGYLGDRYRAGQSR